MYDAFGNKVECEEQVENRFGFAGELYDPVSALVYLRARFYNPVIGRFLQEDNVYEDGLNLYVYCRNNPVRYVDPSGHGTESPADKDGGDGKSGTGDANNKKIQNVGDLSAEQLEALRKYTGDDYKNINDSLRGMDTLTPENQSAVEAMKSALENASLPEDMTLYRGTSTEALGALQNLSPEELIGKTFTEQAFMSTSTNSTVAKEGFANNMYMTIEASQGAKALDISSISQYTTESEILFNVGQNMLIKSAEVKDGILYITVIVE